MDKNQILEFIKQSTLAVFSTADSSGKTQAGVMAVAVADDWNIYLSTENNTRKVANLQTNPQSTLVFGGLQSPSVQADGLSVIASGEEIEKCKNCILSIHPDTKDYLTPTTVYIKFTPKWVKYSDYNQNPPLISEMSF